MSTFTFESFIDYEGGKMARVYTLEDDAVSGVPLNIHIDNADLHPALEKCLCEIDVKGIAGDLDLYASSEEYEKAETFFAEKSLIPTGAFPLPGKEDSFTPSAHVIFSGRVLTVWYNPGSDPDEPNYCLWVDTLGFCFALYLRYEGLIEEGYVVLGNAWLFGDITDVQEMDESAFLSASEGYIDPSRYRAASRLEYKMRHSVGEYVLLTAENNSGTARYQGRIDEFFLSEKYQIPCIRGHFIRVGNKVFDEYELMDIVPLSGTEADILRGKITGETIQEYILPLTDEQLAFLAKELNVDLEDLPFLPEDGIGAVSEMISGIAAEEREAAEHEGGELSERGRTAKEIETVIGNKRTGISASV